MRGGEPRRVRGARSVPRGGSLQPRDGHLQQPRRRRRHGVQRQQRLPRADACQAGVRARAPSGALRWTSAIVGNLQPRTGVCNPRRGRRSPGQRRQRPTQADVPGGRALGASPAPRSISATWWEPATPRRVRSNPPRRRHGVQRATPARPTPARRACVGASSGRGGSQCHVGNPRAARPLRTWLRRWRAWRRRPAPDPTSARRASPGRRRGFDSDGVPDCSDNCPSAANPGRRTSTATAPGTLATRRRWFRPRSPPVPATPAPFATAGKVACWGAGVSGQLGIGWRFDSPGRCSFRG